MAEFIFEHMVVFWVMMAVIVFVCLFFYTAPYGRHAQKSLTPSVKGPAGWVVMEMPAQKRIEALRIVRTSRISRRGTRR